MYANHAYYYWDNVFATHFANTLQNMAVEPRPQREQDRKTGGLVISGFNDNAVYNRRLGDAKTFLVNQGGNTLKSQSSNSRCRKKTDAKMKTPASGATPAIPKRDYDDPPAGPLRTSRPINAFSTDSVDQSPTEPDRQSRDFPPIGGVCGYNGGIPRPLYAAYQQPPPQSPYFVADDQLSFMPAPEYLAAPPPQYRAAVPLMAAVPTDYEMYTYGERKRQRQQRGKKRVSRSKSLEYAPPPLVPLRPPPHAFYYGTPPHFATPPFSAYRSTRPPTTEAAANFFADPYSSQQMQLALMPPPQFLAAAAGPPPPLVPYIATPTKSRSLIDVPPAKSSGAQKWTAAAGNDVKGETSALCYSVCCKGLTQVLWVIIGIILVGLILGLVLGLTLV